MSEQAQPLRLREPAHLVSPRARLMWLVEGAFLMLVLLAGQVLWWFVDASKSAVTADRKPEEEGLRLEA